MTSAADSPEDPRVRFAAERTLLAWVRTGIALMGFGFVIARFGLFLRELASPDHPARPSWPSVMLGVGMIALGVVTTGLSAWQYQAVIRRIDARGAFQPPRLSLGLLLAAVLAAAGVGVAVYLFTL